MQESNQAIVEARYYERKVLSSDKRKVKDIIDFHNIVIKDSILYKTIEKNVPSAKILDVAVGRGNDMHKWQRIGAEFVFGIDYAAKSIRDTEDCAYSRYLNMIVENRALDKPVPIPKIFFAIGDSSMRFIDGSSGESDEERDIMRSIFGRVAPIGPVPPAVQKYGADQLKEKADVVLCMYAIHYFFETEQKFDGLLQNIADNLKVGGYFIGTNFDVQAVFDLLRNTEKGKSKVGMDKESILW
jgi:mRNA (guanine-N7-)-methyltransferase